MNYWGKEVDKPVIDVDRDGLGLVILRPTGVLCSNQTGGLACLHPLEEGVYVPVETRGDEYRKIGSHFTGSKWRGSCWNGIDSGSAKYLDEILSTSESLSFLRVDRDRLKDSHEAWIYVTVSPTDKDPEMCVIAGFGHCNGVLTWRNSD